jgi:hypothetical protein
MSARPVDGCRGIEAICDGDAIVAHRVARYGPTIEESPPPILSYRPAHTDSVIYITAKASKSHYQSPLTFR